VKSLGLVFIEEWRIETGSARDRAQCDPQELGRARYVNEEEDDGAAREIVPHAA